MNLVCKKNLGPRGYPVEVTINPWEDTLFCRMLGNRGVRITFHGEQTTELVVRKPGRGQDTYFLHPGNMIPAIHIPSTRSTLSYRVICHR